jgi:hypothetical protein
MMLITHSNDTDLPWKEQSKFHELSTKLEQLKEKLPMDMILNQRRTNGQIALQTYRYYVLMHSVFAISDMALHREYLPTLPYQEDKPKGPIDGPMCNELKDAAEREKMDGWWEEDAEKCFKAAREFLDLMWTSYENGALVETPMTGFSLFYVLQISM